MSKWYVTERRHERVEGVGGNTKDETASLLVLTMTVDRNVCKPWKWWYKRGFRVRREKG